MNKIWPYTVPGIPDNLFIRGAVPMTKREVRALTISQARLMPGLTVWDVGAGTGSLSVEAALFCPEGRVFAVEKNREGVALIGQNSRHFGLDNVVTVEGEAPEALDGLPCPHRIIVGGSGGRLEEILSVCADRLQPQGVLTANVFSPRNLACFLEFLSKAPFSRPEGVLIQASRLEKLGAEDIFRAQNGIWIISAVKEAQ